MRAAHVPEEIGFATKPRLALDMTARAIAAGVPFSWVVSDTVYGTGEVEMALRRAGKGYVLGTAATQPFNAWINKPQVAGAAEEIAHGLDASAWQRLPAGAGTKGALFYDWAYLEVADLEADEFNPTLEGTWTRGLLIRRNLAGVARTWGRMLACPGLAGMTAVLTTRADVWPRGRT